MAGCRVIGSLAGAGGVGTFTGRSGSAARLALATSILAAITTGVVIGLTLGGSSLSPSMEGRSVSLPIDVAAAGVAALSYAVYFSSPFSIMVWPVVVGAAGHGLRWLAIDILGASPVLGAGIADVVLVPVCRKLHLPFTAIGFASVVALVPGVYLFRAASGAVDLLTATGDSLTTLVGAVAQDSATAAVIIVAMIVALALPVATTDHLWGALRSARTR